MGVSVGHLDWSLVPYYRKSFWKHFRDGLYWIDNKNESAAPGPLPTEAYNNPQGFVDKGLVMRS